MAIPRLEVMYIQAVFECERCGRRFSKVFRSHSNFMMRAYIANTTCEVCRLIGGGDVQVINMIDLPLQHLEEFMAWA